MATSSASSGMRVLISGASGMVGTALRASLSRPSAWNRFQPEVYTLVRHEPANEREIFWDPYEMRIDLKKCEGFDAVVHLAGENIGSGDGPLAFLGWWTERKKHRIIESRRRGTQLLAQALAATKRRPKVLVSASGVGYYGSSGDTVLDERSPKGSGFLSDVAEVWEAGTQAASKAGIRVVNLRFGVILSRHDGALAKMYWPFFFGGGGVIGSGKQWMSWITLEDAVRAIEHAIQSPNPVRNEDFVHALGAAMSRPTIIPMPEAIVRTAFGEMGEETLLTSQRAVPTKLEASSFRFMHPEIREAMVSALA